MGSDTTVREEPPGQAAPKRLWLQWVWPEFRLVPLEGARLGIGRDETAAISISGARVSRRHAELYRQGPLYVLHDLGSTNGTWLAGRPVEHTPVAPRSVLRVGDWVGVFVLRGDEPSDFGELAPGLFGGPELAQVVAPIRRIAKDAIPVLLTGATGTGKERIARALHHFSGRSGPFLAVNCAALPEQLAEAELFGYRKGAFTGAERSSNGYFRSADGGTLFLDEVADLPLHLQSKLLRVLDDGEVLGLGETASVSTNVQVVSAVQRPLAELVAGQRFRQDLAARLSGLDVEIPPLAARTPDVVGLFSLFLARRCGGRPPAVESRLIESLCLHAWPENVRELELVTRTLLAVHGHEPVLKREHLPPAIAGSFGDDVAVRAPSATPPAPVRERREYDLERVKAELQRSGGNVKATAEKLGLSRQRVYRLLEGKVRGEQASPDCGGGSADPDAE